MASHFGRGVEPRRLRIACHNPAEENALSPRVRWSSAKGLTITVTSEELVILVRVLAAVLVGALIGFERTFHGRPAGFRTHALVCVASSLLMLVTVYQNQWMTIVPLDAIRTDPTRMAQCIMTGIGFLGAGVIFKEGLTVRGLTTAARNPIPVMMPWAIRVGSVRMASSGT